MAHIDYGLGIVSAKVFSQYPADRPLDLADVYQALADQQRLAGMEVYSRFYEIGSHAGLKAADEYFSKMEKA
jgi:NDP-sugar pyrophosphorylase family protein